MQSSASRLQLILALTCFLNAGLLSATGFPKLPQYPIGPPGSISVADLMGTASSTWSLGRNAARCLVRTPRSQ